MSDSKFVNFIPVLFLTLIVCIATIALTITNSFTESKIDEQKENKVKQKLKEIFPSMDNFEYDDSTEIYTIYLDDNLIGYAFIAEGMGYGGLIEILVGIQDFETIQGIFIISHLETPGLGEKVTESSFRDQFVGLNLDEVKLTKDGGKVDAITGATISSSAVVKAVRKITLEKIALLRGVDERAQIIQTMMADLFPAMNHTVYNDNTEVYTVHSNDTTIGYAFIAEGSGYKGTIEILVGLKDLERLEGIRIISESETPEIGDKITETSFTDQFVGLSISDVKFTEDGGQIDAITGATDSSSAVVNSVRNAAEKKVQLLQE